MTLLNKSKGYNKQKNKFANCKLKRMGELSSAIKLKCPRCGISELFENTGIIPKKGMFNMLTNCSNCNLKYEKEVGFFYGAMYISYMLNMSFFVATTVAYYVFFEDRIDWHIYIIIYITVTIFLTKWIYRMSRSLWLMIMVKSDLKFQKK